MKVFNVHERWLETSMESAGALIDGLSGPDDRLWPGDRWPKMAFDGPLAPGSKGGHGPVRYRVREYRPGRKAAFDFEKHGLTRGLAGGHSFELRPGDGGVWLRHVIEADCRFGSWLHWRLLIRPLHDALLEDALDNAENIAGRPPARPARWGLWVRLLRWIIARGARGA
ncbi:MAG: SRPBCC family protein [Proteobacteria bacterium]|nr:SRPBCC family protein [Pseudomonadota bacterium]